jgi:hypothetical protein
MASDEMQAYLRQLKAEEQTLGKRNRYLLAALAAGLLLLVGALWGLYGATVGSYAAIDRVEVVQHPINQGRLVVRFRVNSPGKVYCRRSSAGTETDLIDHFQGPCEVSRPWAWVYRPGEDITVTLWYRRGLFPARYRATFPTSSRADIVVIMDTTGSMSPSIDQLKEKCVTFSEQLKGQAVKPRFALVGFGDANEGDWLDRHEFTGDVGRFQQWVAGVARFDGGDFPESALDALEAALSLPFSADGMRRFYLVTDADYHEPSRSGATAERVARRLADARVSLQVFSRPQFARAYEKLVGDDGRFQEIENFGRALSEGRILEQ